MMTSLTYRKLELLISLHFPMVATKIHKEGVSLDVASGLPFQCFDVAVWYFEEAWEVEYDRLFLNPFHFLENFF